MDEEHPSGQVELGACPKCERTFAVDRLEKHTKICENKKKRKTFNISKQRMQGTEGEGLIKKGNCK